ncbi:hypothetical protein AAFC00_002788 [Neodothiora populina]|uniref:DUF4211 domain-containing protein n=1 Tax=Neodothiora populina TaxID=2781224 RepID=A0ABR3P881_9PEZI
MGPSKRSRQSRLVFSPLPSSSPASSQYNKQIRDRAAAVRIEDSPSPAKRRRVRDAPGTSSLKAIPLDDDSDKNVLPTPDATLASPEVISDDGKLNQHTQPSQRMSSRKKMKQKRLQFDSSPPSASKMSVNMAPPVKPYTMPPSPMPKAGFFGTQKTMDYESSDDEVQHGGHTSSSDSERVVAKSTKGKRKRSPRPQETRQDDAEKGEDEDDEEDAAPTTPAARRRRRVQEEQPKTESDGQQESSPFAAAEEDDSDDDVVVTGSRSRSKRKVVSRSSDEGSPVEQPRSRKRLRRLNPISEEEQQDLEEDLRDLASSGSETEIRPSQKKKTNPRLEALARLKRKREGGPTDIQDGNGDATEHNEEDESYDEDANLGGPDEQDNDDDEFAALAPSGLTRKQMFHRDEDDEGFVIEDDDGTLGVPETVPIQYTRYASMKAKDLFRYAIDWMVQKKINPAFPMQDEIYDLTFKKLDDEVKGLAGSKFVSSAWTPEFKFTLEARPDLVSSRIDRGSAEHFLRDKCDACNRSGHPATYELLFQGRPYHASTLEPVARAGDSDSDSDSASSSASEPGDGDDVAYDSKGRPIALSDRVFYVGKFCMFNAQTAHSLSHWRYHLYEWVVDYLNQAGYNAPEKIVKRDSWSTRKRRKYGDKIVDAMQTDGKIKALYRDFKNEIDTARNAKIGRFDSSP